MLSCCWIEGKSVCPNAMPPLAQDTRSLVFSSASLDKATVSHPSLVALPKGRLIAAFDLAGPGVKTQPGKKGRNAMTGHLVQSRIVLSDDGGASWTERGTLPFGSARLFRLGSSVYALGHTGNLCIGHSSDGGVTWRTAELTTATGSKNRFVLGTANVLEHDGYIYAALTVLTDDSCKGNTASAHGIVVARAEIKSNLEKPGSWSFTQDAPPFRDQLSERAGNGVGLPWYEVPYADRGIDLARMTIKGGSVGSGKGSKGGKGGRGTGRWANRIGWTEAHLARIANPDHLWHGEQALHVVAGLYSHRTNFGSLLRVDTSDPALPLMFEHTPAGPPVPFLPIPGAHHKFDLAFDETSGLHLLLGNLPGDSMTKLGALPRKRSGLPCDELNRLALHVSSNLVDWHCAFVAAAEPVLYEPAMAVHGDDLHLIARAAPTDPARPYNTLEIVHYKASGFRSFVG